MTHRVFANGPGDRGSIQGGGKAKTQKIALDISLLNTHPYKVWINGKWNNVVPSPTPRCRSY